MTEMPERRQLGGTPFKIAGYPGLAIVCFVAAAGGGVWLLLTIFMNDRRTDKGRA